MAFNVKVPFKKVYKEGIGKICTKDIIYGKELGYTLKFLAIGKNLDNKIEVHVQPTFIKKNHLLANVSGAFNGVLLKGNYVGDIMQNII